MFKKFSKVYGIDLGTSNTVISEKGKGIVLSEPTVVAVDRTTGDLLAAGAEALAMVGRTPEHVDVISPLRDGAVASFDLTSRMLQMFMKKVQGRKAVLRGAQVIISVPCGITGVQKRAAEETVVLKGSQRAVTVEEPLAAAIGAGLPIHEPIGHFVLNVGGGKCQAAILSLGGIVASHTLNQAGNALDRDIMDFMKKSHNLEIGERTAEIIKMQIGTALSGAEEKVLEVRGRFVLDGLPRSVRLHSQEILPVIDGYVNSLIDLIRLTIEQCPPELAGDVIEQGILLTGGGALLEGLEERIRSEVGVPVHLAERPMECTALGTGMMNVS